MKNETEIMDVFNLKTKTCGKCRVYPDNPGGPAPSVTSICGALMKYGLIDWAANCAVDYIDEAYSDEAYSIPGPIWEVIKKEARQAHNRIKEEAGDTGTNVHELCQMCLEHGVTVMTDNENYGAADVITKKMVDNFAAWCGKEGIELIATEVKVHGDGYSGRCDLIAYRKGKLGLYDIKTTPAYYPEQGLQLAAYAKAWDDKVRRNTIGPIEMGKTAMQESEFIEEIGIIRLDKKTGSCNFSESGRGPHFTEHRERLTKAFMLLKDFYWLYNNLEEQFKELKGKH